MESPSNLRQAIIRAAREILDEPDTGLDLRKVAERVGKSRTAPYLVFGRTEEGGGLAALRLAAAASGFDDLLAEIEAVLTTGEDPEVLFRRVGEVYIGFALRHPRLFRLMFGPEVARAMADRSGRAPGPEVQEVIRARADLERLMREVVEACQGVGAMESGDPYPLVMGAWAIFHGAAMLLLDGQLQTAGVATSPRDAAAFASRFVLDNPALVVAEAARSLAEAELRKASAAEPARDPRIARSVLREAAWPPQKQLSDRELEAESGPLAAFADYVVHESRSDYFPAAPPPPSRLEPIRPKSEPAELRDVLARTPALRRARRARGVLAGSRILWIDDQPELSRAEQRTLEALGVEVVRALDTVPALELVASASAGGRPFDAIISDIARPYSKTGGVDALPLIREIAPETSIVFYVGKTDYRADPPPGSFGITSEPAELLHLVIDVLERRKG